MSRPKAREGRQRSFASARPAEVRRGSRAGTRRSPRSARRRCWSASSGDPNNSPRSRSKASARTSTAAATPSSASSATTWWSPPTCSPTRTRSSRSSSSTGTRPDAPGSRSRCRRSSTTAGVRRSRLTAWASTASASWPGPTSSRPGGATSPRSSRPASTPTSTAKRVRSSPSSARSGRADVTAPRSRRGSNACAAASTGRPRRASTDW